MVEKRSPVCSVVGHVDHGKSSILDFIRKSNIVSKEAGAITQSIGASIIPMETIKKVCGSLLDHLKGKLDIPGLLFIDTPGHAAFTNLRKRGGNLADIAILVIDINEGIKPQTEECIEVLKSYKTPFVIAFNKIDKIHGFRSNTSINLLKNLESQGDNVKRDFDNKFYTILGELSQKYNLNTERFDRINDFTKQIAIVPCSAMTGEGIPELLMVMMGLAQKYLSEKLILNTKGSAKGTILEVKDAKGLGTVLDTIIYDGSIKVGDTIIIGSLGEPIVTTVKALFEPDQLAEMRDAKSKFKSVKEVVAAKGVRIVPKLAENIVAGMPIRVCCRAEINKVAGEIKDEVEEVLIETDEDGVICKADSLGSLEALVKFLRENDVKIRKASIGNITKKDLVDAKSNIDISPTNSVVLGFNVKNNLVNNEGVKVILGEIIYKILDDYKEFKEQVNIELKRKELDDLTWPAKIEILSGYVFRQSNPAVFGIEVLNGKLKSTSEIMKDGKNITYIKSIKDKKDTLSEAEKGKQVAVSCPGITVGRQVNEGDILFTKITEDEFKKFKEYKDYLGGDTKALLKEISNIMRRTNPVWGI